jgi:hypothetical protein
MDYAKMMSENHRSTMMHLGRMSKNHLDTMVSMAQATAGKKSTPPPPYPDPVASSTARVIHWNVSQTVAFLEEEGYNSYADYFEVEQLNGMALLQVEQDDIEEMPEKHKLKKRAFAQLVNRLNEEQ